MSAIFGKRLISGIVSLLAVSLIFMPIFVPVTWWVTIIPGVVMLAFQGFAWTKMDYIFIAGDFAYYLAIGGVLGLATIIVDNSEEVSLLFADNETRALAQALQSAEAAFEQTAGDLDAIRRSIQSVNARILEVADDPVPEVDTDLLASCLANQFTEDLQNSFNDDWDRQSFDFPRIDEFVDPCVWIANPRHPADIARDRRASLMERRAELEAQYLRDSQALGDAQAAFDASRRVWITVTDQQRRRLLFEIFPCVLLIGVSTKLGKVTNTINT